MTVYLAMVCAYAFFQCAYNVCHSCMWSKDMMNQDHPGHFFAWLLSLALCIPPIIVIGVLSQYSKLEITIR